jgi:ParB family transcriptional regulator, chromosome partitioning protein
MHAIEIALDRITVPTGRRAVDAEAVERPKQSIVAIGIQHPITVREHDGGYMLIAGAHRVAACRENRMERIPANVVQLNPLEAELLEIDENLVRNELSPAEKARVIKRRKAVYEQLFPETKHGSPGVSRQVGDTRGRTKIERFTKATADAMGVSESSVQRDAHRGEVLGEETLAKIAHTSLDKSTELDALARLPVVERDSLVARAAAGEKVTAKPPAESVATAVAPETVVAGADGAQLPARSSAVDPDDDDTLWDALWRAFLAKGDQAIAMAVYDDGPLDEDILEKVRSVISAWQQLLISLTAELAKEAGSWQG